MKRRIFLDCAGAIAMLPAVARAQVPGRIYRIGVIVPVAKDDQGHLNTLAGLKAAGFVDGRNLIEDPRGFSLHPDKMAAAARELVAAKVDLLMAGGGSAIRAAQAASSTIPIVGVADDMIREGLVGSLANRAGNTTGISFLSTELDGKRQEILMEFLPKAQKMALLADDSLLQAEPLKAMQERARSGGVDLSVLRIQKPDDIEAALDAAKAAGVQAINILASPLLFSARQKIFAKATLAGMPTMYQWAEGIKEGAAICYGPSFDETFQQWGRLTGKVLRGTRPGDLPVEQPTSFKLTINLKVARQLGITPPASMLQRADEIAE